MLAFMLALSISAFAEGEIPIGGRTCTDPKAAECQPTNSGNSGNNSAASGVLGSDVTEVITSTDSEDDSILEAVISYLKTIF